ncbi:MAG: sensor histidine kinase [Alphaproteobacteria bacterium]|nr:sensor histidine kinase [Alphaproteobacteria bacterium]
MSSADIVSLVTKTRPDSTLSDEVNHRVANHLTLLANLVQAQAATVAKGPAEYSRDQVQGILREVASKLIGVGQLHRRLVAMHPDEDIDLGDYLIESSHSLVKSLALENRVGIVHRLDTRCPVKTEQVQTVALIVGEIIMNAIKHAHPTGIPVEISIYCGRSAAKRVIVEIGDDGVGLPEKFDARRDGGTGLRLIRQLAAMIEADLSIQSDSLGTRFMLTLPGA